MLFGGIAILLFPANKDKLDFSEFYAAAQMVREGHGKDLYNLRLQTEFQSRVAEFHAVYVRPPFEALLFVPLTYTNFRTAYSLWTVASLGLLAFAAFLIKAQTGIGQAISRYTKHAGDFGLILVVFLTFAPMTTCLLLGQDSPLLLLCCTLCFVLLKRGSHFLSGCALAFGLFKFNLVLPFVLVLLLRKKWSAVGGFATVATGLVLVSVAVSGPPILGEYTRVVLFDSSYRRLMDSPAFMPNLRGLLCLVAPGKLAPSAVPVLAALLSLIAIGWVVKNWRDDRLDLSFCAGILAALLAGYHSYNYDLVLLLLPVALMGGSLGEVKRPIPDSKLLLAALVMLFLPPLHFFLVTHGIYALMCIPIIFLFIFVLRRLREGEHKEKTT